MITGRQLRDARLRAGLELREVATRAGVAPLQLAYAEAMYGAPEWAEEDFDRVRRALEAAGVEFTADPPRARLRPIPSTSPDEN